MAQEIRLTAAAASRWLHALVGPVIHPLGLSEMKVLTVDRVRGACSIIVDHDARSVIAVDAAGKRLDRRSRTGL